MFSLCVAVVGGVDHLPHQGFPRSSVRGMYGTAEVLLEAGAAVETPVPEPCGASPLPRIGAGAPLCGSVCAYLALVGVVLYMRERDAQKVRQVAG